MKNVVIGGILVGAGVLIGVGAAGLFTSKETPSAVVEQQEQPAQETGAAPSKTDESESKQQLSVIANREKVEYIKEDYTLKVTKDDDTVEVKEYTSEPVFNADSSQLAVIYPYSFEEMSELYTYDFATENWTKVIPFDLETEQVPKAVLWINKDRMLVIIGYRHGTVSIGGNLYVCDVPSGEITQIKAFPEEIQITSLARDEHGKIVLTGIKYTDSEYNDNIPYEEKHSLAELLN